jgi:peroxiredoxin
MQLDKGIQLNKKMQLFSTFFLLFGIFMLAGCQEDLNPSDKDKRPSVQVGSVGNYVGQLAADFTMDTTVGDTLVLSDLLLSNDAVVLYFTMWCPLCDSHMDSLRQNVKPDYINVSFLIVDYVTGSVSQSRSSQLANGYASETVLPDINQALVKQFSGTMGSTIVIQSDRTILMNEDYKEGKLLSILSNLN